MLIKATIHLPEGRRRGNRRGTGEGEAVGKQTQPALKSFEKPHSATPTTVGPVGQEKEREKKKKAASAVKGPAPLLARTLLALPGSRHEILLGGGGGRKAT